MSDVLELRLLGFLERICVRPLRFFLETGQVRTTMPQLRGVWGLALRHFSSELYHGVFEPPEPELPLYVLRPALPEPRWAPTAFDCLLLGSAAAEAKALMRVWDVASGRGLGPDREMFRVIRVRGLKPDGSQGRQETWSLDRAVWPFSGQTPCRLTFRSPLRILRNKRLVETPTLCDLVASLNRRVEALLPVPLRAAWKSGAGTLVEEARRLPGEWRGERQDLIRYSGRQKAEIELRGVVGTLTLPEGVGCLWPLLAAARWTHVGKGTVFGLGHFDVEIVGNAASMDSASAAAVRNDDEISS